MRDAWRDFAAARRGKLHENGSWFDREPVVDFTLDDVLLRVEARSLSQNSSFTSASARFVCGSGPIFEVRPRGIASGFAEMIGVEHVDLADTAFDNRFAVKCDDAIATARVWTAHARQLIRRVGGARVGGGA